jgi:hypothetical protein
MRVLHPIVTMRVGGTVFSHSVELVQDFGKQVDRLSEVVCGQDLRRELSNTGEKNARGA